MKVRWTQSRTDHIASRSLRYLEATNIEVAWADEAVTDPRAVVHDPDPRSKTGATRIVGYSPTAGFVITVIALRLDEDLWGVSAWKTSGAERRDYQEGHR